MTALEDSARAALWRHWRHTDFRPGQREVVAAVLRGEDVLAVLPTGGGKSVCYQVPAVVLGGVTAVVSPLIALMQDQVAGLRARGVSATFLNSQLSARELEQRLTDAEYGMYRLLYVAPERFASELFRQRVQRIDFRLLAIDEAHCISEWGPDFRPAYRRLAEAAELLGRPPIIALTATATPEVRRDIVEQLALRQPRVIVSGFDRPNVVPSIFRTSAKLEKLREVLASVPGSAIVYVATRAAADHTAERLRQGGVAAAAYHAGLAAAERMIAQERWQQGAVRAIVATNAFGMGIDKPDVRAVIHLGVPLSVEAYYQEAGRAGRDGRTAYAVLLFAESDAPAAVSFVQESRPGPEAVRAVFDTACSLARIAIGSPAETPFVLDLEKVAAAAALSPMTVRAAVELLEREGAWEQVALGARRVLVRLLQPASALRAFAARASSEFVKGLIEALLRARPAEAVQQWGELDLHALGRAAELTPERLLQGLDLLGQHGVLDYLPPGEGIRVRLLAPRPAKVPLDALALRANRERALRRLDVMLRYARSSSCRRHFLLSYFGERASERCGACDVCLGRHRVQVITPDDEPLLQRLLDHVQAGDTSDTWLADSELHTPRIVGLTDWLVHEGYIRLSDPLSGRYELTDLGAEALTARR